MQVGLSAVYQCVLPSVHKECRLNNTSVSSDVVVDSTQTTPSRYYLERIRDTHALRAKDMSNKYASNVPNIA